MKINFLTPLKEHSGEEIKDGKGESFLLRDAAIVALDSMLADEKNVDPKEKYRRDYLATRIYRAKEPIALDVDDIKLVKDRIGKVYGPRIVHEAWDLLDPKDAPPEPKSEPTLAVPRVHKF
jgi:hypothetical protein